MLGLVAARRRASRCRADALDALDAGDCRAVVPSRWPDLDPGFDARGGLLRRARPRVIFAGTNEELMTLPLGATDPDWTRILSVTPGATTTAILETSLTSGPNGPVLTIDGRWRLPTIGGDAIPVGRSANNATFVLVEDRSRVRGPSTDSRFVVLRAADGLGWEVARTLELRGALDFDALSPNGAVLYVVEQLDPENTGRYQVRSIDLASGVMDAMPIADKRLIDEAMAGKPITQLRRADGLVLTLYLGPDHPFVHALNSADQWAVCIDLPPGGADDAAAQKDWGLSERPAAKRSMR